MTGKKAHRHADDRRRLQAVHPGHWKLGDALVLLGKIRVEQGKAAEGLQAIEEGLIIRSRVFGDAHWKTAYARCIKGRCLTELKQVDEAESLLQSAYGTLSNGFPPADLKVKEALRALVRLYEAKGDSERADDYRERLDAGGS